MDFQVVIPHRDRGRDWRRQANLESAVRWWRDLGIDPLVVDDGRSGDEQFNRSAAYNRGVRATSADVIVFSEADLLVPLTQIEQAVALAAERPGLVVPFSKFLAMEDEDSTLVRGRILKPSEASSEQIRGDNQSIGAVNVVSRRSVEMIGQYDEAFDGAWFDDDATEMAFRVCCGPTRFVNGPGYHQYHLPNVGDAENVTDDDRAATERNKARWELYRRAITPERIRELTAGGS